MPSKKNRRGGGQPQQRPIIAPARVPQDNTLSNARLVLNGIHVFCSVCILSAPYGLRLSGWLGLPIFIVFGGCAIYTAHLLKACFDIRQGLIRTYVNLGEEAFGVIGRRFFALILFCLAYATCIEATIVAKDALVYYYPKVELMTGEHGFSLGIFVAIFVEVLMLFLVSCLDIGGRLDLLLTGSGVCFTIMIVLAQSRLLWEEHMEYQFERTVFLHESTLPMAIGFFSYCFIGHTYIPELHQSLANRDQYMRTVMWIFGPTMFLYVTASVTGYVLFGNEVESLFILSMQKRYFATRFTLVCTIIHQIIRYLFGIREMANLLRQNLMGLNEVLSRGFLVAATIPACLVAPKYGLLVAFIGSLLGTLVALVMPCMCYLSIHWGHLTPRQAVPCMVLIMLGITSAICGIVKSISEIVKAS